jgi:hypothetical protein
LIYNIETVTQDKSNDQQGFMSIVPSSSQDLHSAEAMWFAAHCSDVYEFIGIANADIRSGWDHRPEIAKEAGPQGPFRLQRGTGCFHRPSDVANRGEPKEGHPVIHLFGLSVFR